MSLSPARANMLAEVLRQKDGQRSMTTDQAKEAWGITLTEAQVNEAELDHALQEPLASQQARGQFLRGALELDLRARQAAGVAPREKTMAELADDYIKACIATMKTAMSRRNGDGKLVAPSGNDVFEELVGQFADPNANAASPFKYGPEPSWRAFFTLANFGNIPRPVTRPGTSLLKWVLDGDALEGLLHELEMDGAQIEQRIGVDLEGNYAFLYKISLVLPLDLNHWALEITLPKSTGVQISPRFVNDARRCLSPKNEHDVMRDEDAAITAVLHAMAKVPQRTITILVGLVAHGKIHKTGQNSGVLGLVSQLVGGGLVSTASILRHLAYCSGRYSLESNRLTVESALEEYEKENAHWKRDNPKPAREVDSPAQAAKAHRAARAVGVRLLQPTSRPNSAEDMLRTAAASTSLLASTRSLARSRTTYLFGYNSAIWTTARRAWAVDMGYASWYIRPKDIPRYPNWAYFLLDGDVTYRVGNYASNGRAFAKIWSWAKTEATALAERDGRQNTACKMSRFNAKLNRDAQFKKEAFERYLAGLRLSDEGYPETADAFVAHYMLAIQANRLGGRRDLPLAHTLLIILWWIVFGSLVDITVALAPILRCREDTLYAHVERMVKAGVFRDEYGKEVHPSYGNSAPVAGDYDELDEDEMFGQADMPEDAEGRAKRVRKSPRTYLGFKLISGTRLDKRRKWAREQLPVLQRAVRRYERSNALVRPFTRMKREQLDEAVLREANDLVPVIAASQPDSLDLALGQEQTSINGKHRSVKSEIDPRAWRVAGSKLDNLRKLTLGNRA